MRYVVTNVKGTSFWDAILYEFELYGPASGGVIAGEDSYSAQQSTALSVPAPGVSANDFDSGGLPLSAALVADVSDGVLALSANGAFTYTPADGFTGTDAFTYRASNGTQAIRDHGRDDHGGTPRLSPESGVGLGELLVSGRWDVSCPPANPCVRRQPHHLLAHRPVGYDAGEVGPG